MRGGGGGGSGTSVEPVWEPQKWEPTEETGQEEDDEVGGRGNRSSSKGGGESEKESGSEAGSSSTAVGDPDAGTEEAVQRVILASMGLTVS
ncbi:hypothetical protein K402DRAFT_396565 [Aulographum hederae CBS 113979]|uniref:Uncharacterized protein n=1 Tax=Aulographum hederae CBS 113979 TaxID=1176131 RepID=A0A6G1GS30_9PEZI|nr:hypothetical protein K402DRAFT_396565 [Aulographum hederae CBS 113979]